MKKISNKKVCSENSDLPRIYYKYLWLLGQFIQHSLLYLQGIRVPEPPELKIVYPKKSPADLINIQREIYGCKFNWETGALIVSYGDENFDVTTEAKEITANNVSAKVSDCIGFDDRGFDFNTACNTAITEIINNITNGQKKPL